MIEKKEAWDVLFQENGASKKYLWAKRWTREDAIKVVPEYADLLHGSFYIRRVMYYRAFGIIFAIRGKLHGC